jgi:hypothetical protein
MAEVHEVGFPRSRGAHRAAVARRPAPIDGPESRDASSDPVEPTRSERSAACVELRPHRVRLRPSLRMCEPAMSGVGSRGRRYAPARGGPVHRRIHPFRRRARGQSLQPILRRRTTHPPEWTRVPDELTRQQAGLDWTAGFLVADAKGRIVGRVEGPTYGASPQPPGALSVRSRLLGWRRRLVPVDAIETIDERTKVVAGSSAPRSGRSPNCA